MGTGRGMRSCPLSSGKWGGEMRKGSILIRSNLHKAKGQAAAIVILILLAALMLDLWLMLSMDYKKNFDRYHEKLNEGHVTLAVDDDSARMRGSLREIFGEDEDIEGYSMDPAMHMVGLFGYNDGEINSELILLEKQTALSRSVGKIEIVEDSGIESGIYMPMLYKSEDIAVGKTIQVSVGSHKISYKVCGFFNSIMAGSHNCSMCALILTEDKYRELEETGYASRSILCSVRLKDKNESEDQEAMLEETISSRYPDIRTASNSYALVYQSRYISQMVCAGIVSAMAFFILLIALVVIVSNINDYIQENMKDLGALKAIGYTGQQLIGPLLIQFVGLSLLAAVAGIGLSYCLFPYVNTMMISQTGIPYAVHFLPLPMFITLAVLAGTVMLAVWVSARKIKKIEPITALRQGVHTHDPKRDHIPLEKTKVSLHMALALKTTLSGIKHNVTIGVTMLVLSLVVVFLGVMVENVIADMGPFLRLIVGEIADSCINVQPGIEEDFLREVHADPRVEKVYLYSSAEVRHVDGVGLVATMCDDFSRVNNKSVVFEGRFPEFDNEVALAAKYARENDLEIGMEMTMTAGGKKADYIITGFTQISNNLGKDCLLTRAGYERLSEMRDTSYYLDLADGSDIDAFNAQIKERFGDQVNTTINVDATVEGAGAVYVSLMIMIVGGILVLSVLVITFVLYLLVRTLLGSKKRDHGILKALGFTTGQLILQTALSFMPAITCSTIAGLTLCSFIINPLIAVFLRSIGIVKSTFVVPVGLIAGAGAGLIVMAFGIACLLSLRVRKIAPRGLLTGE